jgi:hypothetical protein
MHNQSTSHSRASTAAFLVASLFLTPSVTLCCSCLLTQLADAVDDKSVIVTKQAAGSCVIEDTLFTVLPVVAPQLPIPALDPTIQLQQSQKSPLVSAVSNASALLVSLMQI